MSHAILCAGRLYFDVIFRDTPRLPSLGTEVFAGGVSMHAGGGAYITAATLSALGNAASQFSVLPAKPFDTSVLAELTAQNVSAKLCTHAADGVDPQITVAMACQSDRAFLTRADGPALPRIDSSVMAAFSHLHIGELSTLEENPTLIEAARSNGMTISLDCGWQDTFRPDVESLIASVDVFLPNRREADALLAAGVGEHCAKLTVIKNGEKGACAWRRQQPGWVHEAASPVRVVDATGAGDAFNGGFISEWLKGSPLSECLRLGNACGAAAVGSVGGVGSKGRISGVQHSELNIQ